MNNENFVEMSNVELMETEGGVGLAAFAVLCLLAAGAGYIVGDGAHDKVAELVEENNMNR